MMDKTTLQQQNNDRVQKLICRTGSKRDLLIAEFAREEHLHLYPDDWGILEMGEALSHIKDLYAKEEEDEARASGKVLPQPSPAMIQFRKIQRHLFDCRNDVTSTIISYVQAIGKIREIKFTNPEEKAKADLMTTLLDQSIIRLKANKH